MRKIRRALPLHLSPRNLPPLCLLPVLLVAGALACADSGDEIVSQSEVYPETPVLVAQEAPLFGAIAELEVRGAEVSLQPSVGVVYLEVINRGFTADRLVGAESPIAAAAETHETVDDNGVMRMTPRPDGFEVPGHASLLLERGGKHLMLLEPHADAELTAVPLTLEFERAGTVQIEIPIANGPGATDDAMDHGSTDHGSMDHGSMEHEGMDHGSMEHGDSDSH